MEQSWGAGCGAGFTTREAGLAPDKPLRAEKENEPAQGLGRGQLGDWPPRLMCRSAARVSTGRILFQGQRFLGLRMLGLEENPLFIDKDPVLVTYSWFHS